MELTDRKREILKEVISLYILTGEPVGSKAVMQRMKKPCSSATIRNEMAELEEMELLTHPHTSAGRAPTTRGYRLYVDSLMEDYRLDFEERLLLNSILADPDRNGASLMRDVTRLLARMTGYAVVAFSREGVGTIERFQGVYVNPVIPPATQPGNCLLRTSYMATLTYELIEEALDIFEKVLKK